MLRITASTSAGQAKSYYTEGFSKDDYYTEGQDIIGKWGGKGAELLGLSGQVDREAFMALCDNLHPQTGERLRPGPRRFVPWGTILPSMYQNLFPLFTPSPATTELSTS